MSSSCVASLAIFALTFIHVISGVASHGVNLKPHLCFSVSSFVVICLTRIIIPLILTSYSIVRSCFTTRPTYLEAECVTLDSSVNYAVMFSSTQTLVCSPSMTMSSPVTSTTTQLNRFVVLLAFLIVRWLAALCNTAGVTVQE